MTCSVAIITFLFFIKTPRSIVTAYIKAAEAKVYTIWGWILNKSVGIFHNYLPF